MSLRVSAAHALAFENYFLWHYKEFLLADLQHQDKFRQLYAVKTLGQIIYLNPAVKLTLQAVKSSHSQ